MAPKPLPLLFALVSLAAVPQLGLTLLARAEGDPAPAVSEPSAAPEPAPAPTAVAPAAPLPSPPPPPPLVPTPAATLPADPLRPPFLQPRSQPRQRFDASLDALVRDGVVSPAERIRVRGGFTAPINAGVQQQACRSGALSERECRTGVVFLGRGRQDGAGSSGLGSDGLSSGAVAGLGGERYGIDASPLPPISVPVSALLTGAGGSFRLTDVFRVTPRPAPIGGNGNARFLFPLIGSAVTTSGFGWRLHPLLGSWLMHSGRDLAAPEGTPVVAALSGRVVSSGTAGGYGLAIELEHERPRRRTLYGHLSELYVKEGDTVRQGEVIGRVGSTGLSTGPHLHFEVRLPQDGGWVAVDPGDLDPGGSMVAGLPGMPGLAGGQGPDAVAMLMGQLLQTLERPRSPLPFPVRSEDGTPAAAPAPRG